MGVRPDEVFTDQFGFIKFIYFDLENKNMLIRVTLNGPSGEYANIEANSLLGLKTKGKLLVTYLFFFKTIKINSVFLFKIS